MRPLQVKARLAKPAQLDIVYGKFPYDNAPASPGPMAHPCLVLDTFEVWQTEQFWVIVAVGTSKKVDALLAGQFCVLPAHGRAFERSGLKFPTKFSFERTKLAKVPYSDAWFSPYPNQSGRRINPKIGRLDAHFYSTQMEAAAKSVNIRASLDALESVAVGALEI